MNSFIRLENVSFAAEEYMILKNITVEIPKDLCTVIIGSSGSGKSTLLKVAAGIFPPDTGKVLLDNHDLTLMPYKKLLEFKKLSGFIFQDAALWSNKTIHQNLSLPLEFHFKGMKHDAINKKIADLMKMVEFNDSEQLRPAQLSSGERKLVAFLRAIITDPQYIFMDEPVETIDNTRSAILINFIKEMKAKKSTIVIVTNDEELTSHFADYLIIMKDGQILEAGAFNAVKNTNNPDAQRILKEVLGEAASYDSDILDLLKD